MEVASRFEEWILIKWENQVVKEFVVKVVSKDQQAGLRLGHCARGWTELSEGWTDRGARCRGSPVGALLLPRSDELANTGTSHKVTPETWMQHGCKCVSNLIMV